MKVDEEKKSKSSPRIVTGSSILMRFRKFRKRNSHRSAEGGHDADGSRFPRSRILVRVHEIKDTTVVIDFNHPMAGKTLYFDVKVSETKTEK